MTDKPAILVLTPHLAPFVHALEADYTVFRFWEGPPIEAAHTIGALVTVGEFPVDKHLAESLPNLGLIACFAVGYEGVDLAWARARGLKVSHSPGANAEDVADHAMGLILAAGRRIAEGDRLVRAGAWQSGEKLLSRSLRGRRLGVLGLGDIGVALAERAAPFGMDVAWWGPRENPEAPWPRRESLLELAPKADILAVCARAVPETRGIVTAEVIDALGPDGMLVNVSRGSLVDEDALIDALKAGRLGAAGLDVFATEPTPAARWADVPNVVLTPHTAGAASAAVPRMIAMTRENLRRHFAGEPILNPVPDP